MLLQVLDFYIGGTTAEPPRLGAAPNLSDRISFPAPLNAIKFGAPLISP